MSTWTADSLYLPISADNCPTTEDTRGMLDELYREWVPGEVGNIRELHMWACERFETSLEAITPGILEKATSRRIMQYKKLFNLIKDNNELSTDGIVRERVERVAKVIREARNSLQAVAVLYFQMDDNQQLAISHAWNPDSFFQFEDEKATNFQKLLLHILKKLAVDQFRKLDDHCYKQVIIEKTGEQSHAWEDCMSIKDYIFNRVQKETDYEEWKCLTNPHDNGDKVVSHLIASTQIEFPALVMNRYLWAYNNGLYNVLEDMFWPFHSVHVKNVADVTADAIRALPVHVLQDDEFALNVATADTQQDGVYIWNIGDDGELTHETCFKVDDNFYTNFVGREIWPKLAADITTFRRGMHVGNISEVTTARISSLSPIELSQQDLQHLPNDEVAVTANGVFVWNVEANGQLSVLTVFRLNGTFYANRNGHRIWTTPSGQLYSVHVPTAEDVAVKHFDCDFRFEITPESDATFDPESIELPEMDRIMSTQELTSDSMKWTVLMLCRLFFPVGYDKWQVVLFIKGIAGSGKSTLAKIIRNFYPPARITTLASNIEQKFGLSGIYKGLVCICAEVREDFGLDQADWQSAVSGEEVQIAVKQKTAFSHKWDTPFFFLGNELPNYRNNSGSVDRRIFMIEFRKKVKDSDPKLIDKFMSNIDLFQRKGVSLYHQALHEHGHRDIWAEGVVGDQLREWRNAVKESSDILHAFITSGIFEFTISSFMPLDDFKTRYLEYRKTNGYSSIQFKPDHYNAVFQDMSVNIQKDTRTYDNQTRTIQWVNGLNLRQELS